MASNTGYTMGATVWCAFVCTRFQIIFHHLFFGIGLTRKIDSCLQIDSRGAEVREQDLIEVKRMN